MDLDIYLEKKENSEFTTADFSLNPDLWGPVPLHHLNPKDMKKHSTVRIAQHRLVKWQLI